jgi:hypothetical protein
MGMTLEIELNEDEARWLSAVLKMQTDEHRKRMGLSDSKKHEAIMNDDLRRLIALGESAADGKLALDRDDAFSLPDRLRQLAIFIQATGNPEGPSGYSERHAAFYNRLADRIEEFIETEE